jgi:predicted double-glycine peptidase
VESRKAEARADLIVAYAEARQNNLQTAREWFWKVRDEASKLPDHGARKHRIGESRPTLEEEAAFQHAVCTGALGEQSEAEAEYREIMKEFPSSSLVHASVKRIARFHGGNVPPKSEAIWKEAVKEAKRREDAAQARISRCGPECLAELLRRRDAQGIGPQSHFANRTVNSQSSTLNSLSKEMRTNKDGTSVAALVSAAKRRGIPARGLMLTQKGLEQQKLPVAAILVPGHYVLVNAVSPTSVTIWDPYLNGPSKPGMRELRLKDWKKKWNGVAIALK